MSKINLVIVGTINPNEKEALSYYVEQVGKLYSDVNAKSVGKYKISESLIGEHIPSLVSVMEFDDMKSLEEVFEGAAYQELLPYRDKAFSKLEAYIS